LSRYFGNTQLTQSGEEHFSFCSDGRLLYHYEQLTDYTSGVTDAQGTWQVKSAQFNAQGTMAEGVVAYTSHHPEVPAGEGKIVLAGTSQAFIGQQEYQRVPAGC
jgi:hypothetical protein